MNLHIKLFPYILLIPFFSSAQSYYQPGCVVNLQGDTLHGFIKYAEWENNPSRILFKSTQNSDPKEFTVNDLKYFNVYVGHLAGYVKYTGPISTDNTDINHLSVGRDSSLRQDTVFLKVLQQGSKLLLFSYSDNLKTRFFIATNFSEKPTELIYRIYYKNIDEDGSGRTVYENTYKGQLYQAAKKAGVVNKALIDCLKTSDYKEENLRHFASLINGLSETDPSKNNVSKPGKLNVAIVVAVVIFIGAWLIHDFAVGHH